ncbi:MAG: polyribonucleotide nucleotidyltransferase, partial [bacterium JZ-2024 1]
INPSFSEVEEGTLNLVVALDHEGVVMLECEAKEVAEEAILGAMEFSRPYIAELISLVEELKQRAGKPKIALPQWQPPEEVKSWLEEYALPAVESAWEAGEKPLREEILSALREQVVAEAVTRFPEISRPQIFSALEEILRKAFRARLLEGKRPDKRKNTEIRPLKMKTGFLPRAHGSALFQRGLTQVLTTCTLGKPSEQQMIEDLSPEEFKRYLHQYNFPGYSTGEVKPIRSPGRREIGHGSLAERALEPVIPPLERFPYTLRVVSEVVSSNGSTSMASVCGSTLALMDAGVPLKRPVAGISIGLVMEDEKYCLLNDIQGLEDAYGDMDFKVAGTSEGITAIQLDIKKFHLPISIIEEALEQAKQARGYILEEMKKILPAPKPELSPYAPRILAWKIPRTKIGDLIGPGGKHIRAITEETGVIIDVEEDGQVYFTGDSFQKVERALKKAKQLVGELEPGSVLHGKIRRIFQFGLLVEVMPGKVGLVHISEIPADEGVDWKTRYRIGDMVTVRVLDVDESSGRISLSMKGIKSPPRR